MRLEALFRPKSIAVVGASDKPTIGRRLIASLDRIGFAGPIFPINPNYSAVSGRKCYVNAAELHAIASRLQLDLSGRSFSVNGRFCLGPARR